MRTAVIKMICFMLITLFACDAQEQIDNKTHEQKETEQSAQEEEKVKTAAERTEQYLPVLKDKNIAVVVNQTSRVGDQHLVDTLLAEGINIRVIFAPEHGFRGEAAAGAQVKDTIDLQSGLAVYSLYGKSYKPSPEQLQGIDIVVFDIQDAGARFYTYISTMHYVMEACAENNITFMVLDRPNPNGFYISGPILEKEHSSFVGIHSVPLVHGMTIAEYAQMINGEYWLKDSLQCDLQYITCENYDHSTLYELPVKPSPNLPNMTSIYLYPSLALFEGTAISVARGTDFPFQAIGHPQLKEEYQFQFTPEDRPGATNPKLEGEICYGIDLRETEPSYFTSMKRLELKWLISFYNAFPDKDQFFNSFFLKLAGTAELKDQIIAGKSAEEIYESWEEGLDQFRKTREKYLLYSE